MPFRCPVHSLIVEDLSVTPHRWEVGHGFFKSNNTGHQSTASGPHNTCQLYAVVAYLIISRILSNTRRRVVEGGTLVPTGSSVLAYTGCIFVPSGSSLCAYPRAASLCFRAHRCAPTHWLHLRVYGLVVGPIQTLIRLLWLSPLSVSKKEGRDGQPSN